MKVAMVEFAGFGGLAQYCYQLSQALSRDNEVIVFTAKKYELDDLPRDFALVKVFDRYQTKWADMRVAWRYIKAFRPDVVHIQGSDHPEIYLPIVLLLKGIVKFRVAFTAHETKVHWGLPLSGFLVRFISKLGDTVIVHNAKSFDELHGGSPLMDGKVVSIPHGHYIFPFFHDIPIQPLERSENILFFGRIDKTKGLDVLLEAFSLVLKSIPSARLIIAGRVLEPIDSWDRYQNLINKYSLAKFIDLDLRYIPMDELPGLFNRSRMVVLPYLSSNQSGVIPLAYAFARPVISTRVGGLPEAVKDGVTGLLVRSRDAPGLAEAIIKLLRDPELSKRFGEEGRRFAEQKLDWGQIAERHFSAFLYRNARLP